MFFEVSSLDTTMPETDDPQFWIGSAKLPFGVDVEKFKAEVL